MESGKKRVLITGITGFLGSHCLKTFLDSGNYIVRGTVRSLANPAKMDPLKQAFGERFNSIELAEADLMNE